MGWKETDKRLIRRGELILDIGSLKNNEEELKNMNKHKRGPHFKLANSYITLLATVRYLYQMPYRQLQGFTHTLHGLVPALPPGDYSGLRKRILRLDLSPYRHLQESDEPVAISLDSTGVKVHKAGGWVERVHGKKSRYVKLHFAVNTETHEVVAMEVSTDDAHDVKAFPGLIEGAEKRVRVAKVFGDGAYDSGDVYDLLEAKGVEAVVKPRRNSRLDTRSPARRRAVELYRRLGYRDWAKSTGYGRRWAVETVYSTFKRVFGEGCMARGLVNIASELAGKVGVYNMLVNM